MRRKNPEVVLDSVFLSFLDVYKEKQATYYNYTAALRKWVAFSKLNGKESLEFKKNDKDANTEKLVMKFRTSLKEQGASDNQAKGCCSAVRSFYANNRVPLCFIEQEKRKMNVVERKTTDYKFSKDDVVKMLVDANLQEQWILLGGISFGLRASDFLALTIGQLRQVKLDEEPPLPFPEVHTMKEKVVANPFVTSDLVPIIKEILTRHSDAKDTDRILSFADEQPLSKTIKSLFKRAKLVSGGATVRFHELRSYLATRLSSVAGESQWKQIIGKAIDEGAYVTTEELREVYKKAMPLIIVTNGNSKNHIEVEALKKENLDLKNKVNTLEEVLRILAKDRLEEKPNTEVSERKVLGSVGSEIPESKEKQILRNFIENKA
jgi:integrase